MASPTAAANPPVSHGHHRAGTSTPVAVLARCSSRAPAKAPTPSPSELAEHDQAAVEGVGDGGHGQPGQGRDEAVVEVGPTVVDVALDAGDLRRHVEVAARQRPGLDVVEVARERPPLEQRPRPARRRQQEEHDAAASTVPAHAARRAARPPAPDQAPVRRPPPPPDAWHDRPSWHPVRPGGGTPAGEHRPVRSRVRDRDPGAGGPARRRAAAPRRAGTAPGPSPWPPPSSGCPLLVAVVALRGERWFPVLDLAMTEFRVRDVFTADTPLIGLPGRIGEYPDQGSHPGPLSFYVLAPTYRLLGSSSWALEAATVVVHLAAIATALWIGQRRLGWKGVAAVAALLALAIRGLRPGPADPAVEPVPAAAGVDRRAAGDVGRAVRRPPDADPARRRRHALRPDPRAVPAAGRRHGRARARRRRSSTLRRAPPDDRPPVRRSRAVERRRRRRALAAAACSIS